MLDPTISQVLNMKGQPPDVGVGPLIQLFVLIACGAGFTIHAVYSGCLYARSQWTHGPRVPLNTNVRECFIFHSFDICPSKSDTNPLRPLLNQLNAYF